MVIIIALISVVFFVVGISLLFKSYRDIPSASKLVPDQDHARVTQELEKTRNESQQLKQQLDMLAVELDETRQNLQQSEQKGKAYDDLKAKESEYEDKIQQLQHDLNFLYSKADQQASRAVDALNELDVQKKHIQDDLASLDQKMQEAPIDDLKAEREALQKQLEETLAKTQALESERDQLQALVNQEQEKNQNMDKQKDDRRQVLAGHIKQLHTRIKEFESGLTDMLRLKEQQFQNAQTQVRQLNQSLQTLKKQEADNEQKIQELQESIAKQAAAAVAESGNVPMGRRSTRRQEVPAGADAEIQRLKNKNAVLTEKESRLMFELTKSRAKVMGLEKLCRDMRQQRQSNE